ncbi:NADP-dependent oxidoreductase domain-containing protein [Kickxella alabastrina]|uniref:NADP-dependent oxidoreductase domain-containing protein n=1 Tax=Kickxella alabastrina TaxID=61397 RepID=UPI00221F751E|nr:NADP-dependent oxidoreductase domain-containing protein [Kickxella alabastrina]KAI7829270.1 NADP-dependent oxidoreductase domain-containing protein [Kickxella alabastrina]KAJ1947795.1 hypothetical protein GGF37_000172 [Kickxella alabastrina]
MELVKSDALQLSKVGLGCGVFGGAYGITSQDSVVQTVRKALSSGMNICDTSPYYNDSEVRLGKALLELQEEFPRASYHICTKLGRYGYTKAEFDYSAQRVVDSVHESMRRLHTDYLDIVLCHDVEFVDVTQVIDEALPELFELKRQGVVRKVGISGYPLDTLLEIAQIQQQRGQPLDVCLSYCNFNLHCQLLNEFIPKLRSAGIQTIISASPLSMGLLCANAAPEWHPAKQELKDAVARCAELIAQSGVGVSLAEMAEHFSFSCTRADMHLVGSKTEPEVSHALSAYERAQRLNLAAGGRYDDPQVQRLYEQIRDMLEPFAMYTWPSPPADA